MARLPRDQNTGIRPTLPPDACSGDRILLLSLRGTQSRMGGGERLHLRVSLESSQLLLQPHGPLLGYMAESFP